MLRLDYSPREWQREVHLKHKEQRFMVMALHRRAGKTQMSLMQLLDSALKSDKKLPMFTYVGPFLRQAKAVAWSGPLPIIEPLGGADATT